VIERVWASLPAGAREVLEAKLSPTDLQTLLLDLARTRANREDPASLLRRWRADRFVRPSPVDPIRLSRVTSRLWELVGDSPFTGLVLSPVTPLGSSSAVGPVDQNRIVSTARTSEVVSDPTNALALEAAVRRRATREPVHLAACHRVLRAQQFSDTDAYAHFELFALVSSARDAGSARTETALLTAHLAFWQRALSEMVGARWGAVVYTLIDNEAMRAGVGDAAAAAGMTADLREDPGRTQAIGYYRTAAFKIIVRAGPDQQELGDGGFTGWTAALLADAKERCLISCLATERLASLASSPGG
jgi:hypothetical protein